MEGNKIRVVWVGSEVPELGWAAAARLIGTEAADLERVVLVPGGGSPLEASQSTARALAERLSEQQAGAVLFDAAGGAAFWALAHRAEYGIGRVPTILWMGASISLPLDVMNREQFRMADGVVVESETRRLRLIEHLDLEPDRVGTSASLPSATQVRHSRSQAGLATGAVKRLERSATGRSPWWSKPAGVVARLMPTSLARWVARALPDRVRNRLRGVVDVGRDEQRRRERQRARVVRDRLRRGELVEISSPEVSVVIACFNQGRFVKGAIESVLVQTFQSFEVIVVDDGSTDPDTITVLDGLDYPRTAVIRQENCGLPGARNAGMRRARGRFLVPLDADDELAPTYLAEFFEAISPHPQAAFVHCWSELFGDQHAVWVTRPYNPYQQLLSNGLVGCVLLRREAWEQVGGYVEDLTSGNEDWDLWLRLLGAGWDQVEVPRPLFRYRRHGVSMSVDTEARFERARLEMVGRHPELYGRADELKAAWYPWVSVLLSPSSDLSSLGGQDLDDLEVVVVGNPSAGLRGLCEERSWPLRETASVDTAVRLAHGKNLVWWDDLTGAGSSVLEDLARALEEAPHATAAGWDGHPVLWRRWALLDPASPHDGVVSVDPHGTVETTGTITRGGFPAPGWALPAEVGGFPVVRQAPEEEGSLPGWMAGAGEETVS
jgi:GT2 family glycosyltransferase